MQKRSILVLVDVIMRNIVWSKGFRFMVASETMSHTF